MNYPLFKPVKRILSYYFISILFSSFCLSSTIDYILISKSNRELSIMVGDKVTEKFKISLGFEPIGKKTKRGDGKTPEGLYYIEDKIKNSAYFLALKISYPNPWDIRQALTQGYHPGGQIMIHGVPNKNYDKRYHNTENDWTEGCIAISNNQINKIWKKVEIGTPVLIRE